MKNGVGVWIDHREAVVVMVGDAGEDIQHIPSNMEKHVRFSGSGPGASAEDIRDRRFANHLGQYYEAVISRIREAGPILILGPGEAKVELKQRLEGEGLGGRIVGLETVDKMTERQIAAKVHQHFLA